MARGEVSERHDAETLADIIVGALSGGIVNWTVDGTYPLETNLHNLGVALADLFTAEQPVSPSNLDSHQRLVVCRGDEQLVVPAATEADVGRHDLGGSPTSPMQRPQVSITSMRSPAVSATQ